MNFFESELRKIVGAVYPDATFVGRTCYVQLSDMNRAKIQFTTCGTIDHYEAIQMTILNRNEGQVDTLRLRFADVWGKGQVNNLYNKQTGPYAWTYCGQTEWYAYKPTQADYRKISESVANYLNVFRSPEERRPALSDQIQLASTRASIPSTAPELTAKEVATDSLHIALTKRELDMVKQSLDMMGDRRADREGYSSGEAYWDLKEKLEGFEAKAPKQQPLER